LKNRKGKLTFTRREQGYDYSYPAAASFRKERTGRRQKKRYRSIGEKLQTSREREGDAVLKPGERSKKKKETPASKRELPCWGRGCMSFI